MDNGLYAEEILVTSRPQVIGGTTGPSSVSLLLSRGFGDLLR